MEAYSGVLTNNDYAFVVGVDSVGNTTYSRYKYNASTQQWALEYVLNNSSFTAEQWAAINSSITSGLVTKLSALPTNSELTTLLNGKVDKENGKGLSTNDYTTAEKTKLSDLPTNSQLQLFLEGKANKIPMPPVVHELVVEGATQVSDVITLITGRFEERPAESIQIFGTFKNPSIIEFSVNYTGKLRFEGIRESVILKYIKAYVNGTLVETSTERIISSEILSFDVEANDVVKVEFTI